MFLLALVWFIAVVVFFFLNEWFQCWEMIDNNKKNSIKPKQKQKKSAQPWPWLVRGVFPTRSVVVFNMSPGRSDSQNVQPENCLFSPLTPPKKKDHRQGKQKKRSLKPNWTTSRQDEQISSFEWFISILSPSPRSFFIDRMCPCIGGDDSFITNRGHQPFGKVGTTSWVLIIAKGEQF